MTTLPTTTGRRARKAMLEAELLQADERARYNRRTSEWHRVQAVVRESLAVIADQDAAQLRQQLGELG